MNIKIDKIKNIELIGYSSVFSQDNVEYKKDSPIITSSIKPKETKIVNSIKEAIILAGLKDGMCISFHHHFRDGDYVTSKVMEEIHMLGIKNLYICASSLGKAHSSLVPMIEDETITRISSSGLRGEIGEAISEGKLKYPALIRSHGGRVGAIERGDVHIDVAFIGAPTSDDYGNASGKGGKSDCGVLSYAHVDSKHADKVIVVTDTIVDYPNIPYSISGIDVDYVVKIDQVGDAEKIASNAIRMTSDPRELMIAELASECVTNTPWFKNGFSFQTGAGGISLAVTQFLRNKMIENNIKMKFALGGIVEPIVDLLNEGLIDFIADTQDFDIAAVNSVHNTKGHIEITASEYANPYNKGAFVNKLDYVILGALEIDLDFNVNVVVGSDGTIQGAPGGHVDTAAGSKCSIVVMPLIRGRLASVRNKVTSVTTPGDSIDILITDYGIAINPKRKDIVDSLSNTGLPIVRIEELRDKAYQIVGEPDELEFDDKIVAFVEYRDGSIIDVVKKPK